MQEGDAKASALPAIGRVYADVGTAATSPSDVYLPRLAADLAVLDVVLDRAASGVEADLDGCPAVGANHGRGVRGQRVFLIVIVVGHDAAALRGKEGDAHASSSWHRAGCRKGDAGVAPTGIAPTADADVALTTLQITPGARGSGSASRRTRARSR